MQNSLKADAITVENGVTSLQIAEIKVTKSQEETKHGAKEAIDPQRNAPTVTNLGILWISVGRSKEKRRIRWQQKKMTLFYLLEK